MKFVNLLIKYKASIEDRDINGMNALHIAVRSGHDQIVAQFLQSAGDYDLNTQDIHGNTALMYAVLAKDLGITEQIIDALKRYHLSVDITNNRGITPLILATILGLNEIANSLIVVGKASQQLRDTHLHKTAAEWEQDPKLKRNVAVYFTKLPAIHSCSARPIDMSTEITGADPVITEIMKQVHENPHKTRVINDCSRYARQRLCNTTNPMSKPSFSLGITCAEKDYRWPDLRQAYGLYEKELSSSYRKGAPPRVKTPPPPTSESSSDAGLFVKAVNAMRMKQRRHTIALSQSLPNNLNMKLIFSRRSTPNKAVGRRSFSEPDENHIRENPVLKRRSSILRGTHSKAPFTAPAGIDFSVPPKGCNIKRRHSVSFQSLRINHDASLPQSPGKARAVARRSSLTLGESTSRKASVGGETSEPIFEHEEHLE